MPKKKSFKYRISYRIVEAGVRTPRYVEFQYDSFARARKNYKSILLSFYKHRQLETYEVCLNRSTDNSWQNPIYYDKGVKP